MRWASLWLVLVILSYSATASAAPHATTLRKEAFGGGYGGPGSFTNTVIDLTHENGKISGKIRQPFDRTDEPAITNLQSARGKLSFDAGSLHFDLRRTQHGYAGTVREGRKSRAASFLLRPGAAPPATLATYEGTYAIGPGRTLTLSRNNAGSGSWYLELPSGRTGFLYNVSDTEFIAGPCIYCAGPEYLHLWFSSRPAKRTDRFNARIAGRNYVARRLAAYREEDVTFRSADGTLIAGSLFLPVGKGNFPAVVFAHGSGAQTRNGYYGHIRFLAEAYARKGIAALAFDKRGTGDSKGDWEKASLAVLGQDVAAGVRYLRSRNDIDADQIGLTGSSQAGWVMPLATREVFDVLFIQHRSAASPLGVREQERRRLILQMQFDDYPQAEIDCALHIRDMMDAYATTGKGWEQLEAAARAVEKEYWMTQFIGGLPSRESPDWAWLRDNFAIDTTLDFVKFRGSWDVMYGQKDPIAPLKEGRAALEAALRRGNARDVTIEVVPDATHNYLKARIGSDREFPGLSRFVPGIYDRIVDWASTRMSRRKSLPAHAPLRPAPEKLEPWTTLLRERQPENAFAAVYKRGRQKLVFVAAQHANRDDSLTFRLIREAYAAFEFETVVAEGFPTSRGPNPTSIFEYAAKTGPRSDGFVEGGETVPTVVGARQQKAKLWGGEPDDLDVKAHVIAAGISGADLLGLYVLRNIPQWIGERKIAHAGDPHLKPLVEDALARDRAALHLPPDVLADYAEWASWYQRLNGKPLGPGFVTEETGPLADGKFGSNRIAFAISRARDAHLHKLIIGHLNAGESVLVVFGGSHLMIQRPALDAAIGQPCYIGTQLPLAAASCR